MTEIIANRVNTIYANANDPLKIMATAPEYKRTPGRTLFFINYGPGDAWLNFEYDNPPALGRTDCLLLRVGATYEHALRIERGFVFQVIFSQTSVFSFELD